MKVRECEVKLSDGYTMNRLAQEMDIPEPTLRQKLKGVGFTHENRKWIFVGDDSVLDEDIENITTGANRNKKVLNSSPKTQKSSSNTQSLTNDEIKVLKDIIKEHKSLSVNSKKYELYDEITKVPQPSEDDDKIRRSYTMSKETVGRFEKFAKERRLPFQDLVELAIIQLLEKYQ